MKLIDEFEQEKKKIAEEKLRRTRPPNEYRWPFWRILVGLVVAFIIFNLYSFGVATWEATDLPPNSGYVVLGGIAIVGLLLWPNLGAYGLSGIAGLLGLFVVLSLIEDVVNGSGRGEMVKTLIFFGVSMLVLLSAATGFFVLQEKLTGRFKAYGITATLVAVVIALGVLSAKQETKSSLDVIPDRIVGKAGTTHTIMIIAKHDKLSPVRITLDKDVRRPYWIEQGEVVQFNWNTHITIEGDIPATQFVLNGFPYKPASMSKKKIELTAKQASNIPII